MQHERKGSGWDELHAMPREEDLRSDALAELYGLLEGYAPTWYTFDHHERAESALRSMKMF